MYGYELVEAIDKRTDGILAMGQSTLYPLLYNMEAKGLLASRWSEENARPRKYYRLLLDASVSRPTRCNGALLRKRWDHSVLSTRSHDIALALRKVADDTVNLIYASARHCPAH